MNFLKHILYKSKFKEEMYLLHQYLAGFMEQEELNLPVLLL